MDSSEQFYQSIYKYYANIVTDEFPEQYLKGVSKKLANEFHEQYSRFKKQFPKSEKRYSSFQIKDLDHPQTFESIIKYLKSDLTSGYKKHAGELLSMNESEITEFEQSRQEFYNMF